MKSVGLGTCVVYSFPVDAFKEMKFVFMDIGDCHMCEIDIVDFPGRRVVNGIVEPNPEESELVAERTVFFIFQVASVIPPFDAELIVREIIAGELVVVSGKCLLERSEFLGFCVGRWQAEKQGQKCYDKVHRSQASEEKHR